MPKMAKKAVRKNAKNPEENAISRLANKPNFPSFKPNTFPSRLGRDALLGAGLTADSSLDRFEVIIDFLCSSGEPIPQLEYSVMAEAAQIELLPAAKVAQETAVQQATNGICYATYGETNLVTADLEQILQAVPLSMAAALSNHAYYFVPLTLGETEEPMVAPSYTVDLGDRAICHRNIKFGNADCVFISTRLMQDRFALAFEFFINAGHQFVEAAGVPKSFADLIWSQAEADVRGETSQDAYENRRRALDRRRTDGSESPVDEKARNSFLEAAFSDAIAVYLLALTLDFDYSDLREREYPLLAAPALAERLRHVAGLFPPNPGYDFQILYRRRG